MLPGAEGSRRPLQRHTVNKLELNKNATGLNPRRPRTERRRESHRLNIFRRRYRQPLPIPRLPSRRRSPNSCLCFSPTSGGTLYAKIVDKVGTRTYWEDWAKSDVAVTPRPSRHASGALPNESTPDIAAAFDKFVRTLRAHLNDSINRDQAVMLSQP